MEDTQNTGAQGPKLENIAQEQDQRASKVPPVAPLPPRENKKRKLENLDNKHHSYFKICAIVKDLRPHFVEVLRTPDFKNSKAAHEIRKQTKLLVDLCKQMTLETVPLEKSQKPQDHEKKVLENHQEEIKGKHSHPNVVSQRSPALASCENNSQNSDNGQTQQGNVIGGSNFGWNFVMFPGSEAVYYGVTKESFRTKK